MPKRKSDSDLLSSKINITKKVARFTLVEWALLFLLGVIFVTILGLLAIYLINDMIIEWTAIG